MPAEPPNPANAASISCGILDSNLRPSSSPLTPTNSVQEFLDKASNRSQLRDVPYINTTLRMRSRNAIRNSEQNNDLLEFIGDRVLNLMIAIMVEGIKLSRSHHTTVRRIVCNNDTFGRLSFYMHLHENAELDKQDLKAIEEWVPQSTNNPPKVLADLFEACVGAVYIQCGWSKLENWLHKLFTPIIQVVTGHFWLTNTPIQIFGQPNHALPSRAAVPETRSQSKLLDYVEFKRDTLRNLGLRAVKSLPDSTNFMFDSGCRLQEPDIDHVEVAIHLLNMWICQVVIKLWPQYHEATARAAHILSAITGLIVNERVMAYLASLLSLDDLCSRKSLNDLASETDKVKERANSEPKDICEPQRQKGATAIALTLSQRAIILKATIGWFHHKDAVDAMAWGEKWITPLVIRAHDILVELQGFRPLIPRNHHMKEREDTSTAPSVTREDDPISSLLSGMRSLAINADQKSSRTKPGKPEHVLGWSGETNASVRSATLPIGLAGHTSKPTSKIIHVVIASKIGTGDPTVAPTGDDVEDLLSNGLLSLSLSDSSSVVAIGDVPPTSTTGGPESSSQSTIRRKWHPITDTKPTAGHTTGTTPGQKVPIHGEHTKDKSNELNATSRPSCPPEVSQAPVGGSRLEDEPPGSNKRHPLPVVNPIVVKEDPLTMFVPRAVKARGRNMSPTSQPRPEDAGK